MMLSESQVRHYREQGYLAVEDLLTGEECKELNRWAVDVVLGKIPLGPGDAVWMEPAAVDAGLVSADRKDPDYLFKLGHRMHMNDSIARRYATHPGLADILEDLIGPDIKCVQSMFIDKPIGLGVGQPYHQDAWYLKTKPDTLMAVWIACDDVDVDNGCLHVIPGSHTDPIHPHEKPLDPAQRIYAEVRSARTRPEVAVPLKACGAVFFTGHMLHRSGNNLSDRKRRAYVLHYADARSKWLNEPGVENHFLLVRGREHPGGL